MASLSLEPNIQEFNSEMTMQQHLFDLDYDVEQRFYDNPDQTCYLDPFFDPDEFILPTHDSCFLPEYSDFQSTPKRQKVFQDIITPSCFLPGYSDFQSTPKRQKAFQENCLPNIVTPSHGLFNGGFVPNFSSYSIPERIPMPVFGGGCCSNNAEKKGHNSEKKMSVQSIAARQRRKKIGEKTQELGKLIPGGHRMNTAEMLQATFKYIKFLQAQAGLLEFMGSYQENEKSFETRFAQTGGIFLDSGEVIFNSSYVSPCPYPYLATDYGTQLSVVTHHMWMVDFIVGAAAHAAIFMSDVWGSVSDQGVVTHITGGNFAQSSITINGWLRDFLYTGIPGWLHLQPKWKPSVSWFKNAESHLNHHLSGLFGVSSLAWIGHLVHVAIPASRGEYVRCNNFLDVLLHPQGFGQLFTGQWNLYAQNPDSRSHLFGTTQGAGTAILTLLGGFHPQTQSLGLTDIAHHHLAIAFIFLVAGHMYRTNFGIGHSMKDLLDAHIPLGAIGAWT
ncbi:hypothetical protein HAX54_014594 [Datura stramonium]|uniref:BHLH domain-containing protein n=1 Tax=Datura stramonium TaxID=4076 RepID=A0ABS8RYX0_DATST|nr:hypothetical protein [Datura stramonium]